MLRLSKIQDKSAMTNNMKLLSKKFFRVDFKNTSVKSDYYFSFKKFKKGD